MEAKDAEGLQRLLEYFLRCPFRRARMIEVTEQGKVLYKTEHNRPGRFPEAASKDLVTGSKRNFQVFDPLDFLADEAWQTGCRLQFLVQIFDRFPRPDHTALCLAEIVALFEHSRPEERLNSLRRERGND